MRQIKVKCISQQLEIVGNEAKHLIYSLRSKAGERINVIDEMGKRALIELTDFRKDRVTGRLIKILPSRLKEPITLAIAVPKRGFEDIIRQATEIGVFAIQPLITERTVAKPSESKQERWRRIAKEAAEQSGGIEPEIESLINLTEFLSQSRSQLILCNELERQRQIFDIELPDEVTIIIGSEGGFSEDEIETLKERGAISVTLGENILRVDTAAIFSLSIVKFMMNMRHV